METARERHASAKGLPFSFVTYQNNALHTQEFDMSGHGFHVHGPHDHELEHAQQGGHGGEHGGMINQIALFTAVIATVGAIFGYMGGATQANAGLYKNNAAIKKTEASNQWNYFQSKSTKQSLAELARDLAAGEPEKAKYQAKVDRYEKEKNEIKLVADKLEPTPRPGTSKRRADAPAPPLGAVHHRAAGLHCHGSDRPADQEKVAGTGDVRRRRRGPGRRCAGGAAHLGLRPA